jgi:hypothetical protein
MGFYPRDKIPEYSLRILDFAATGTIDGNLGAMVEQLHPDLRLAAGAVLRKPKDSDLVYSEADDRNHSCSEILFGNPQQLDIGLRDAQLAKRFVECPAHGHPLDAVGSDADFCTEGKSGRTPILEDKVAARVLLAGSWPTVGGAPI